IEGGGSIQMKKEYKAHVSFTNTCRNSVNGAVLTVEGSGLLQGKQEARMAILKQDEKIEKTVTIMAAGPGTKLLKATFSHSNSPKAISRTFHKVTVALWLSFRSSSPFLLLAVECGALQPIT
ncbi:hypothetical protein JOQ06_006646, partial [Pogonophryne albipinna]